MYVSACLYECDELSVFVYDVHLGERGVPSPPPPPGLYWGKEVNVLLFTKRGPGSGLPRRRGCLLGLRHLPESSVAAPSLRRHIAHPQ